MLKLNLKEYASCEYRLSSNQLETLLQEANTLGLTIEPIRGTKGNYRLRPGSKVGALEIDGISVLINPKISIPQLLSLACYAMGMLNPQEQKLFDFTKADALPDVLALALNTAARRAFGRGLLRGYLTEEEALHTVRGRIRFDEQIRRRYGIPLPVELRFDEFTEDILANRLVKAAAAWLGRMTLHSSEARRGLSWIAAILDNVSLEEFRRRVPDVRFDRLNEHYRHVVGLARLILRHSEFESQRGDVRASGFLVDMNVLFQEFLTQALRETLGVSERTLHDDKGVARVTLDETGKVPLKPDLTWWDGEVCTFVGDAKYKKISDSSGPNADLYQMLAYATALDLPGGLLIYAKGEADTATYQVNHSDKRLVVAALDLSGTLEQIIESVNDIARKIESMRDEACRRRLKKSA